MLDPGQQLDPWILQHLFICEVLLSILVFDAEHIGDHKTHVGEQSDDGIEISLGDAQDTHPTLAINEDALDVPKTKKIRVPLYYTEHVESARVRVEDGSPQTIGLLRDGSIDLEENVAAGGHS